MAGQADRRAQMVERQLRRRDIEDEQVLAAMAAVPREAFLPPRLRHRAYADSALPIGAQQTISQPWIVAAICQALALRGDERVLEVGTGSGYSTAVLARLAATVVSVERHPELSRGAGEALATLGVAKVELVLGDGSRGVPERAPFEAIAVHAAAPAVPQPLLDQLSDGGRIVIPLAAGGEDEMLTLLRREGERVSSEPITPCRFVPLIGEEAFRDAPPRG